MIPLSLLGHFILKAYRFLKALPYLRVRLLLSGAAFLGIIAVSGLVRPPESLVLLLKIAIPLMLGPLLACLVINRLYARVPDHFDSSSVVARNGFRFLAWFVGHNLAWACLFCLFSFVMMIVMGPNDIVLCVVAGALACALLCVAGLPRIPSIPGLTLCWNSDVPSRRPGFLAFIAQTLVLKDRFRFAVNQEPGEMGSLLQELVLVLDARAPASYRLLEPEPDRNFWWGEIKNRLLILLPYFVAVTLFAYLTMALTPGIQPTLPSNAAYLSSETDTSTEDGAGDRADPERKQENKLEEQQATAGSEDGRDREPEDASEGGPGTSGVADETMSEQGGTANSRGENSGGQANGTDSSGGDTSGDSGEGSTESTEKNTFTGEGGQEGATGEGTSDQEADHGTDGQNSSGSESNSGKGNQVESGGEQKGSPSDSRPGGDAISSGDSKSGQGSGNGNQGKSGGEQSGDSPVSESGEDMTSSGNNKSGSPGQPEAGDKESGQDGEGTGSSQSRSTGQDGSAQDQGNRSAPSSESGKSGDAGSGSSNRSENSAKKDSGQNKGEGNEDPDKSGQKSRDQSSDSSESGKSREPGSSSESRSGKGNRDGSGEDSQQEESANSGKQGSGKGDRQSGRDSSQQGKPESSSSSGDDQGTKESPSSSSEGTGSSPNTGDPGQRGGSKPDAGNNASPQNRPGNQGQLGDREEGTGRSGSQAISAQSTGRERARGGGGDGSGKDVGAGPYGERPHAATAPLLPPSGSRSSNIILRVPEGQERGGGPGSGDGSDPISMPSILPENDRDANRKPEQEDGLGKPHQTLPNWIRLLLDRDNPSKPVKTFPEKE